MNRKTILVALALSITAAWIASAVLKKGSLFGGKKGPVVLVAANYISQRQILNEALFVKQPIPSDLHNKGMVSALDTKRRVYAIAPVAKGEILYQSKLGFVDEEPELSYMIDRTQGVISITVTAVTAVSGILKPGDYVDVFATYSKEQLDGLPSLNRPHSITKRIVAGSKVISVGNDVLLPVKTPDVTGNFSRKRQGAELKRVALAVTDTDIEKIVYAQANGKIHLALKTDNAKGAGMDAGYSTTDMQEDLFGTVECIRAEKSEIVRVDR